MLNGTRQARAALAILKSKKTVGGEYPVVVRVYSSIHKKNRDYGTGDFVDIDCNLFPEDSNRFLCNATEILNRMHVNGIAFNFDLFDRQFTDNAGGLSLVKFIASRIVAMDEQKRSSGTYKDLKRRLLEFSGGKDIVFSDLSTSTMDRFKGFLAKTNSENSINIYLRTLKAIWNKAREDGLISKALDNPLNGFKLQSVPTFKMYISNDDLHKIISYSEKIPRSFSKDAQLMFYFSYLCHGMNPIDMFKLKWSNVSNGTITFRRQKTRVPFTIKIKSEVGEILDHYEKSKKSDYIFPVLNDRMSDLEQRRQIGNWRATIAKNIRRIAKIQSVPNYREIDAYTARHTFASHFLLYQKSASIYELMQYMGHSSEKTTRFYINTLKIDLDQEMPWMEGKHIKM